MVFTGDMVEPREVWWDRAVAAGFVPQEVVRPDTTFLVAADVDSLSVKARAARELNDPDHLHGRLPPLPARRGHAEGGLGCGRGT